MAKLLYIVLKSFTSEWGGTAWPKNETLSQACGFDSRNTLYKYVNELIELGLVEKKARAGYSHIYTVIDEVDFLPPFNSKNEHPPENANLGSAQNMTGGSARILSRGSAQRLSNEEEPPTNQSQEGIRTNKGFLDNPRTKKPSRKRSELLAIEIPLLLNTPKFMEAWNLWVDYIKSKSVKKGGLGHTFGLHLKDLEEMGEDKAVRGIYKAIKRGWSAVFDPDSTKPASGNSPAPRPVSSGEPVGMTIKELNKRFAAEDEENRRVEEFRRKQAQERSEAQKATHIPPEPVSLTGGDIHSEECPF